MMKKYLLVSFLLAGCPGLDLKEELGFNNAPPVGGNPDYRDPRCGPGTSGGNCACASGVSGCTETPDAGTATPDGGTPDSGVPVDAGPPCNQYTFTYHNGSATSVWVSGSFTAWATTPAEGALEMVKGANDQWTLTTMIEPEGRHEYKLIVDGNNWIADPSNPETVSDGHTGQNSVLRVCDVAEDACGDLGSFDWGDAVMYFVMVDRFFDGDSGNNQPVQGASGGAAISGSSGQYEGGDLAGVRAKLPYLADLGVTALWLSAPFDNRDSVGAAIDPGADTHMYSGYHGYWPSPADIDYSDPNNPDPRPLVESRIGDEAALQSLITDAHGATSANGHGVKVLFDYVMNHVDQESGLYAAHWDWFARDNGNFRLCGPENLWNDSYWGTRCAFTSYLPPFDFENTEARTWSVNDALWWAKNYGIDGFRLDAIKHVPFSWLTDLRNRLNAEMTDPAGDRFYLVGETFAYDNRDLLKQYIDPGTMLDGQFDFPFKARICEAMFTDRGSLESFASWMDDNDQYYGSGAIMTTWIGNHDVPRPIHFASRQLGDCRQGSNTSNGWTSDYAQPGDAAPYERLGLAFAVMMTNPGIPLIYYGDEIGLAGGGDPDNRRLMPWDPGSINAHQSALRQRVRKLARIRSENPVVARGTRRTLSSDQTSWVYRMGGCGDESKPVLVAINRSDASRLLDVGAGPYDDLISGGTHAGGAVEVPARSFLVLRAK